MESEYIALSQAMRQLIPLREQLKEIQNIVFRASTRPTFNAHSKTFTIIPTSVVHEDNECCLKLASMAKMSPRTKHIALPYHFFRSKVIELEINIVGIGTDNQLADQFTKGLSEEKFVRDRARICGW